MPRAKLTKVEDYTTGVKRRVIELTACTTMEAELWGKLRQSDKRAALLVFDQRLKRMCVVLPDVGGVV